MAKKIQINTDRGGTSQNNQSIYTNDLDLPDDFGKVKEPGIVKADDGALQVKNIEIYSVGLHFNGKVDEDEYAIFGETLLQINTAYQWIVGDYLVYGVDNNYGMAQEFAEKLGREPKTISNWVSVCRQITFSRRREDLSYGHHDAVASLSAEEQDYWLEKASVGNGEDGKNHKPWSVKKLRGEIAKSQGAMQESPATIATYERLATQFDAGLAKLVSQHRKAKSQQDKAKIRKVLQTLVEQAERALNELDAD